VKITVRDIFNREALYIDLGSTVTLQYDAHRVHSRPEWHVQEHVTQKVSTLYSYWMIDKESSVKLVVDVNFKFGLYTVVVGDRNYSANIPYRLGR